MTKKLSKKNLRISIIVSILFLCCLLGYKGYATFYREEWQVGLGFGLPAFNSTIDADASLYLNQHSWNQINASEITFSNVYMDAGPAISSLTISSTKNMTFSTINNQEISYSVVANGTQIFSKLSEPLNVTIDGIDKPNAWSYSASGVLTMNNVTSNAVILFSSAAFGSDDILGTAVAIAIVVSMSISVALIFMFRRRSSDDD
jgi:hypothetical protein